MHIFGIGAIEPFVRGLSSRAQLPLQCSMDSRRTLPGHVPGVSGTIVTRADSRAPLCNVTIILEGFREGLETKGLERQWGRRRNCVVLLVCGLHRGVFQWGPLLPARPNRSSIEERVSGKRTRLRCAKSLAAQRLEILLTTPLLLAVHHSCFTYNNYGRRTIPPGMTLAGMCGFEALPWKRRRSYYLTRYSDLF